MTSDPPAPEPEKPVFTSGARLFLGVVAGVFVTLAIAIPMVIIAASVTSGGSTAAPPPTEAVAALPGEQISLDAGCTACHSSDGSALAGPTWLGLAGSDRELDTGEVVVADDPYLLTSIIDPASQIVSGFSPVMPVTYEEQLTEEEIADLIDYIKSLA